MATNSKILPGGIKNETEWHKLVSFVKKHLRLSFGKQMTDKEAQNIAIDLYCWAQEQKGRNRPVITENNVWNYACESEKIVETV